MIQTISVWTDVNRCGRPVTVVTVENIVKAKSLTKEDPRITHKETQDGLENSSGRVKKKRKIIHDHLGVSKRCARWIPHNMIEQQKRGRIEWCTHIVKKFDGGRSSRVWGIVTSDDTWIFRYDPAGDSTQFGVVTVSGSRV